MSIQTTLARLFGRGGKAAPRLARQTVTHDSVDEMVFGNYSDESPRFRRLAVEERPHIPPDVADPEPIDFTTASPAEIKAWQEQSRAAMTARENAPEYDAWEELSRDYFYAHHHASQPDVMAAEAVDPGVETHRKIMSKLMAEDDFARTRNMTRDNATMAAMATMAGVRTLRGALESELVEQARQAEEFEQERQSADSASDLLDRLREQAREMKANGEQIPQELVDAVKDAVTRKRSHQLKAAEIASNPIPFSQAAHEAIAAAAASAKEAADNASQMPSFGQGFGQGEPVYESPEQALSIAEMWTNNPQLRAIAELYGRVDADMRFKRSRRVIGGQDEIVDLKFGDDLRRVIPSELAFLADDDLEDDFYARYLSGELLVFETVGEEHAGRGPMILVEDESGSMSGDRNVWAKAVSLCMLNIARREKRDFAYVGFSGGRQTEVFLFEAKKALDAQAIVDMAGHFFGGGTVPINGVTAAAEIMDHAAEFRKADIVMVTDGEASFDDEDRRLRDRMGEKGVRFHGIGIGGSFGYLRELCGDDNVVHVHQFDLDNPSEATAHLATHIS